MGFSGDSLMASHQKQFSELTDLVEKLKDINGKTAFENGHATSDEKVHEGVYVGSTIFYGVQQIMAELINKKLNKGPKLSQMFNYSNNKHPRSFV